MLWAFRRKVIFCALGLKSFFHCPSGHVAAGKDTIGAQILYLTGRIDEETLEKKYLSEANEEVTESDVVEEERETGETVEVRNEKSYSTLCGCRRCNEGRELLRRVLFFPYAQGANMLACVFFFCFSMTSRIFFCEEKYNVLYAFPGWSSLFRDREETFYNFGWP